MGWVIEMDEGIAEQRATSPAHSGLERTSKKLKTVDAFSSVRGDAPSPLLLSSRPVA